MKVYTKVVVDMETLETLEEESYEYEGSIAHCGSSGGGGGGSGKVDYPEYMKDAHKVMLGTSMSLDMPLDDAINSAVNADPYALLSGYDPSPHTAEMAHAIDDLDVFINSMESTDEIEAQLAAFDAGMRDINAVVSSAFAIGRQVVASTLLNSKMRAKIELAKLSVEARRIMIIANKEFVQYENEIEVEQAKWPLERLVHGANVMASIGGGTISKEMEGPSKTQSALGGAAAGAAIGAQTGNPYVALAGAVIGGAAGLLSAD